MNPTSDPIPPLAHAIRQVPLDAAAIVAAALADPAREHELLLTPSFNEEELDTVDYDGYDAYFARATMVLIEHLGPPLYQSIPPMNRERTAELRSWRTRVCPGAHADRLRVWDARGQTLYLRFSQLDKDAEVVVGFGAMGCACRHAQQWWSDDD